MTITPAPQAFSEHFESAALGIRASLTELLAELNASPNQPQEISRRFGLNKNLAWKIARIVTTQDLVEVVPLMPGAGGLRLALEAFEREGASQSALQEVRSASAGFDEMIRTHAEDRGGLELLLSSMLPERVDRERLERSRKLAFQGNAANLGLQVGSNFTTTFMTPSQSREGWLDFTLLRGLVGFRRLRPEGTWPLITLRSFGIHGQATPFDPTIEEGQAPLLREFCSEESPPIRSVECDGETRFEMGAGPVGKTASLTTVFAWRLKGAAPIQGDGEPNEVGEHFFRLDLPSERVQYDLLIHRSLSLPEEPEGFLYNLMPGRITYPLSHQESYSLPLPEKVHHLGQVPALATRAIPRYQGMLERICQDGGWELGDFQVHRLVVSYPPIPSFLGMAHPLAPRGEGS